uniref:Uncharacterized protein n=1 Tax=Glossina palpalis gambiensis TaxID=67801 RepID=A0A1B0BTW3_9MUSC
KTPRIYFFFVLAVKTFNCLINNLTVYRLVVFIPMITIVKCVLNLLSHLPSRNYSISLQQTKEITSNNVFKLLLAFLVVAADAIAVVVNFYPKHFSANIVKQQQQRHDDYDYDGDDDDDGIRFQPKLDP